MNPRAALSRVAVLCQAAALCAVLSACGSPSETAAASCDGPEDCGLDEYCRFLDGACGENGGESVCEPRPDRCNANLSPVHGCDGAVYGTDCAAWHAGMDVDETYPVEVPE